MGRSTQILHAFYPRGLTVSQVSPFHWSTQIVYSFSPKGPTASQVSPFQQSTKILHAFYRKGLTVSQVSPFHWSTQILHAFSQRVWQSVRFPHSRLGGSLQRGPSRTHLSHMQPSPHARWRWAKGRLVYLPRLLQHCVTLKTVQSPMSFTVHPVCCSTE